MKILITGGCGFIGSHLVRHFVNNYPDDLIINYDKLTYAGNIENVRDLENKKNYRFIWGDVCNLELMRHLMKEIDAVIHLAAESHVDNSVGDSLVFTMSNTYGTHALLEAARVNGVKRILHVSTDEVYGDIEDGSFHEDSKLAPNNPYSASKAAAEMIARGYYKTYKLPLIMTRGNNVYGSHQYPEKIIPKFTTHLIEDKKVPLHGDGRHVRTYQHVKDTCESIRLVFEKGEPGETYNLGTTDEISNLELTRIILDALGKDDSWIEFVKDRPFNDKRYSIRLDKIRKLGWKQQVPFKQGLQETIAWYKENEDWWKPLKRQGVLRSSHDGK